METITATLDATGMNCPLPILKTKKALNKLAGGSILEITATDPGSVKDIEAFCKQTGNELLSCAESDTGYVFHIRKNAN